ncbi:uncharacterized protein LOC119669685 [Teleopsis dalmanni]|uniref:uncharacterized protein LOC119669685 n=1 Tax=Teleopsis dalmanni TaxID=139649 RepID=UPI000D32B577|nr:uncharacterized protein LOC119669685 [Teleopsis dalmanni]
MEIQKTQIVEVISYKNKLALFCIDIVPRLTKYFCGQNALHSTRWLHLEDWATLDECLQNIIDKYLESKKSTQLHEKFLLNTTIEVEIKKPEITTETLCKLFNDKKINKTDIFITLHCTVKHIDDLAIKRLEVHEDHEYQPQIVNKSNDSNSKNTLNYVPYIPSSLDSTCTALKNVGTDVIEEEYTPKPIQSINTEDTNLGLNAIPSYNPARICTTTDVEQKLNSKTKEDDEEIAESTSESKYEELKTKKLKLKRRRDERKIRSSSNSEFKHGDLGINKNLRKSSREKKAVPTYIEGDYTEDSIVKECLPQSKTHLKKELNFKSNSSDRRTKTSSSRLLQSSHNKEKSKLQADLFGSDDNDDEQANICMEGIKSKKRKYKQLGSDNNKPKRVNYEQQTCESSSSKNSKNLLDSNIQQHQQQESVRLPTKDTYDYKEILKELVRPPKQVETLNLKDMTLDDIQNTLLEYKPMLDIIFEKLKNKSFVRSFNGISHSTVIYLMEDKIQGKLMEILANMYDKDHNSHATVFLNGLLPEWILLIFMKKFQLSRDAAVSHVEAQDDYNSYINMKSDESF